MLTPNRSRLPQALVISASLLLAISLAACWLSALAMYHRLLPTPAFSIAIGGLELAAPCPARFDCDDDLSYYAVWTGHALADRSMQYEQVYFVYLEPRRHR